MLVRLGVNAHTLSDKNKLNTMCVPRDEPGVGENPGEQEQQQQAQEQMPGAQFLAAAVATLQARRYDPELPHLAQMDLLDLYDGGAEMDDQTFE